jgi:hypothetical protein
MAGPYLLPVRWRRMIVPVVALAVACAVIFAVTAYHDWQTAHLEPTYKVKPIPVREPSPFTYKLIWIADPQVPGPAPPAQSQTNPSPARPSKIEPQNPTVTIQQPLRCVLLVQLCIPIPAQSSMNAVDVWTFKFSAPSPYDDLRPSHGGWSLKFSLPQPTRRSQSVYFASTTASPLLIRGWYVNVSGRASPLPPGMDCRMYFSGSRSDDLSGQYQLWLSTKPLIPGANWLGDFVQVVGLEPEFWSTVTGEPENWSTFVTGERGDASAAATAGFQQALANPQSIGIICGAYVRGDPYAGDSIPDPYAGDRILQFTMDSFAVCDPFAPSAKQQNEACAPPSAQQR